MGDALKCVICNADRPKIINKKKKKKKKKKYSPTNPYKSLRTRANMKQNEKRQRSVNSIVGNDILRMLSDEDDDLLDITSSVTNSSNDNRKRKRISDNDFESDLEFKPKPKRKYRDRFNELCSPEKKS